MLTEKEKEILREAEYIYRKPHSGIDWDGQTGWFTPYFIGGSNRSHHSNTLKGLIRKGLIETKKRESLSNIRGSRLYRITGNGLQFVHNLNSPTSQEDF